MQEKLIEIALPKCRIFLTVGEIEKMLSRNPDIWTIGLKRGKAILRARQAAERAKRRQDTPGGMQK